MATENKEDQARQYLLQLCKSKTQISEPIFKILYVSITCKIATLSKVRRKLGFILLLASCDRALPVPAPPHSRTRERTFHGDLDEDKAGAHSLKLLGEGLSSGGALSMMFFVYVVWRKMMWQSWKN